MTKKVKENDDSIIQKVVDLVIKELSALTRRDIGILADRVTKEAKSKERKKLIKERYKKLLTFYSGLADVEKIKTYDSLILNLAFIDVMIDEFREDVSSEGYQAEYLNGKGQWGIKRSESVDLFKKWFSERLSDSERLRVLLGIDSDIPPADDEFAAYQKRRAERGVAKSDTRIQ